MNVDEYSDSSCGTEDNVLMMRRYKRPRNRDIVSQDEWTPRPHPRPLRQGLLLRCSRKALLMESDDGEPEEEDEDGDDEDEEEEAIRRYDLRNRADGRVVGSKVGSRDSMKHRAEAEGEDDSNYEDDFHQVDELDEAPRPRDPSSQGGAHIQPLQIDETVSFDDIGGLSEHINSLKEMVVLPLLFPHFFAKFGTSPPRGVLLCGPPGTGKTLIARALASSASKFGKKVSFYTRKGADVLSKWVGEAERQLKLLFEEAQENQPSIIFFDEIDGLAPVRSSRQDQTHNSIVSTLLALMDGLHSRGQVVLIGATNRVDAIDGALRRPGRFDREFNFTLPGREARAQILDIHTRKWKDAPSKDLKLELAASCVGYCGADLKALCTEAALRAFRERYPQFYTSEENLLIDVDSVKVEKSHFVEAMAAITPAAHRGSVVNSRPLSPIVLPCLQRLLKKAMTIICGIFPAAVSSKQQLSLVDRPRLLLCGDEGVGLDHVVPAVLHELEKFPIHSLALPSLLSDPGAKSAEESLVHVFREARRSTPSILYLPQFHLWWETADGQLKAVLQMLLEELPSDLPILLLGTSTIPLAEICDTPSIFSHCHVLHLSSPSTEDKSLFFDALIEAALSVKSEKQTDAGAPNCREQPTVEMPECDVSVDSIKKVLLDRSEEYNIPQLKRLYTSMMNGVLETKHRSEGKHLKASILQFLFEFAHDQSHF